MMNQAVMVAYLLSDRFIEIDLLIRDQTMVLVIGSLLLGIDTLLLTLGYCVSVNQNI